MEMQQFVARLFVCCQAGPSGGQQKDCSCGKTLTVHFLVGALTFIRYAMNPLSRLITYFLTIVFSPDDFPDEILNIQSPNYIARLLNFRSGRLVEGKLFFVSVSYSTVGREGRF